uniref:Uncharacterized protein n=1 Tax=Odontella aurita TaxID=265563 RepID=A0A7S4ILQ7_9STRA
MIKLNDHVYNIFQPKILTNTAQTAHYATCVRVTYTLTVSKACFLNTLTCNLDIILPPCYRYLTKRNESDLIWFYPPHCEVAALSVASPTGCTKFIHSGLVSVHRMRYPLVTLASLALIHQRQALPEVTRVTDGSRGVDQMGLDLLATSTSSRGVHSLDLDGIHATITVVPRRRSPSDSDPAPTARAATDSSSVSRGGGEKNDAI